MQKNEWDFKGHGFVPWCGITVLGILFGGIIIVLIAVLVTNLSESSSSGNADQAGWALVMCLGGIFLLLWFFYVMFRKTFKDY